MTEAALAMSAELGAELATNDQPTPVDPRTVPVRFSTPKQFARSPAHYAHAVRSGWDESLSMRLGTGTHALLFGQPWIEWTGKVRNGKEWTAFETAHADKAILTRNELRQAQAMADAIRANTQAMAVLFCEGSRHEQRIEWAWDGRAFRSTPDAHTWRHIADLKCLRSADPEDVQWQSRKMHYQAQAALYRRALNSIEGNHIRDCYLVVVENKPPHPVSVMRFTPNALEHGDRLCVNWFEQLRRAEENNKYDGYVREVVDLDVPLSIDEIKFDDDEESES